MFNLSLCTRRPFLIETRLCMSRSRPCFWLVTVCAAVAVYILGIWLHKTLNFFKLIYPAISLISRKFYEYQLIQQFIEDQCCCNHFNFWQILMNRAIHQRNISVTVIILTSNKFYHLSVTFDHSQLLANVPVINYQLPDYQVSRLSVTGYLSRFFQQKNILISGTADFHIWNGSGSCSLQQKVSKIKPSYVFSFHGFLAAFLQLF